MTNSFVGFSKGRSTFAFLIQWAQLGRYSHAFFAFNYLGKWYVIDSTSAGIKIRTMEGFKNHARIVKKYDIESTAEQLKQILHLGVHRSYDKYPMGEIIGNAFQLIVKWLTFGKLKVDNPFSSGERSPRCHELVAIILRDIYGHKFQVDLDDTDLLWLDSFCESELCRR